MAAALIGHSTEPTNNLVTLKATYEVLFTTATTGTIKTITIAFPTGFGISPILIDRSGIGAGVLSVSGTTITYTVSSPVSVPANTPIRLELAEIFQPANPGLILITVTTMSSSGIIDGPTTTATFLTQIGTAAIANGAVTAAKIGAGAVGTTQLAAGAVGTSNIANGAVGTAQIAPGSVSLRTFVTSNTVQSIPPARNFEAFSPTCPTGYIAVGGNVRLDVGLQLTESLSSTSTGTHQDEWVASAYNPTSSSLNLIVGVECATVTP
jgi:hypothetical protein